MRSRYDAREPDHGCFDTSTLVEWLPVFTSRACCDVVVRALEYCREHQGLAIYAWVILYSLASGPIFGVHLNFAATADFRWQPRIRPLSMPPPTEGWLSPV